MDPSNLQLYEKRKDERENDDQRQYREDDLTRAWAICLPRL
jgi:hypothetical protein